MKSPLKIELRHLSQCPVCSRKERKRLFEIKDSLLYECTSCGLRYLDPCLSPEAMSSAYESDESLANFHEFHKGYYEYGDLTTKTKTLADFQRALKLLEKYIQSNSKSRVLFDVGFGNGLFLASAKQRGWTVSGSDTSPKNVELALNKFSLELSCADFEDYDADGVLCDTVSFWDLIEHLPNPGKTLKKAYEMLKPRGFILIGIPNDKSLLAMIATALYRISCGRVKKGIESIYFLEHVAYYNLKTLSELLKRNGFVLRDHFLTSTDLDKYALPKFEKFIARGILLAGKLLGFENRLVALFQKQ